MCKNFNFFPASITYNDYIVRFVRIPASLFNLIPTFVSLCNCTKQVWCLYAFGGDRANHCDKIHRANCESPNLC